MERGLHQFIAVVEEGSISAASKRLNVTQPTITVNIQNLENLYRVQLFERTPQGMTPTRFGSVLYESAQMMMRLETQAKAEIEKLRAGANRIIGIGCGHAWWDHFVKDALRDGRLETAGTRLHIETGNALHCIWKLISGELTISIGHHIPELDPAVGVNFIPLFKMKDGQFVDANHPMLNKVCTWEDLATIPSVNSVPLEQRYNKMLTTMWDDVFPNPAIQPDLPQPSSNSVAVCIDMVKQTQGYITFPIIMADAFAEQGLVPLNMEDDGHTSDVGIFVLHEKQSLTSTQELIDIFFEATEPQRAMYQDAD